ncbi:tRNA uridine-5-carboxymethylaminomethyl(34) synthesis GTPase MnmE [Anaplasmataceae bacterium AB001_6]|nr:tRNA uridine-5-carboxymethylaminomethyl(34) synthesis GTPase MnmE [Anaplasmataceae bacterium AB001_6]
MNTIFALSTIFGKSGIAIFRISGEDAFKTIKQLKITKELKPRSANLCKIFDEDDAEIDNCIVIKFIAPNSFTGENMVEIQAHGSIAIINKVTQILSQIFRIAEPGEFSKRAFENNKMNLIEAEGLSDLIEAETEAQLKQAIQHTSGQSGEKYNTWYKKILEIFSFNESIIDFAEAEEDVPNNMLQTMMKKINFLKEELIETLDDNQIGEKIKEGFKISIIGKPNVGKSSLLNKIAKREVAIVSNIKGTTRDIISLDINLKGYPITIYDTAGIRNANNEIENIGIRKAIESAQIADFIILISTMEYITENSTMLDQIGVDEKKIIRVISKKDQINNVEEVQKQYPKDILYSKNDTITIDIIMDEIYNKIKKMDIFPAVIIRNRHRNNITSMLEKISTIDAKMPPEIIAEQLRSCSKNIENITGQSIENDQILDEIFSTFCIGK